MSASPFGTDWLGAFDALFAQPVLLWSTVFFFVITLAMIGEIIVLRFLVVHVRRRRIRLTARWEPIFFAAVVGDPLPQPPPIRPHERNEVLRVWCNVGDNVSGDARQRLNETGRSLGIPAIALDILRPRSALFGRPTQLDELLALQAVERLKLLTAQGYLEEYVLRAPPPLDRFAARALVSLDPIATAPSIVPVLERQGRWARHLVEDLYDAGAAQASLAYAELLITAPEEAVPGLALLLDRIGDPATVPAVRKRLTRSTDHSPETVAALLNTLSEVGGGGERRLVLAFTAHETWFVRMRATQALGRCGNPHDAGVLETLLCDSNWHTRYHAARAILSLPQLGADHLRAFADRTKDRFAQDMVAHVLAEAQAPAVR